ncbi:uncharacterized protein METZ01_LOCUS222226 [marine metagenome]|uniref:Uncharacterized protein n=1 Tax=marine metagenome TaxID=408172 RepID=A0A382G3E3_9ZZZZ
MVNTCLISYSVEKAILNINCSVLQELWILQGGCLTVKNLWGLLTGDDRVCFLEIRLNLRRPFGGKNGCIYGLLRAT